MIVSAQLSRLRQIGWSEVLTRFAFGGSVTVLAGLIAKFFGPVVGGLFLAFPGIFPAGVTIVERHEIERKERHGVAGVRRGRAVAAVVSAGAALGSIGLIAFGAGASLLLPRLAAWQALSIAAIAWLLFSVSAWILRFRLRLGANS